MPQQQRSTNKCYKDFVTSGLDIDHYAMHETSPGYWEWLICTPKPTLIMASTSVKYSAAKRRLAHA